MIFGRVTIMLKVKCHGYGACIAWSYAVASAGSIAWWFLASESRVEEQSESGRASRFTGLQPSALDGSMFHGVFDAHKLAMWRLFPLQVASIIQNPLVGNSLEVTKVSASIPRCCTCFDSTHMCLSRLFAMFLTSPAVSVLLVEDTSDNARAPPSAMLTYNPLTHPKVHSIHLDKAVRCGGPHACDFP